MKTTISILQIVLTLGVMALPTKGQDVNWYLETSMFQNDHFLGSSIPDNQNSLAVQTGIALFPGEQIRLTADLSGQQVYTNPDYSQGNLWLALDWRSLAGEKVSPWKSFSGLGFGIHQYAADYSYNDYLNLQTYFRTKIDLSNTSFLEARYFLELKAFTELAQGSNLQHWFNIKAHQSFATRTALTLNLGGGIQDFFSLSTLNPLQGNGRRSDRVMTSSVSLPTNSLGYLELRASQSVSATVGLYYDFRIQQRLDDNTAGVIVMEDASSPIIDDFYWSGSQHTLGVNFHFPNLVKLSITGDYLDQVYNNVPVYAFDFGTNNFQLDTNGEKILIENTRNTQVTSFQTTLTKTINIGRYQEQGSLDIWLQGRYDKFDGNDPLYQYSGQQWQTGLTYNF